MRKLICSFLALATVFSSAVLVGCNPDEPAVTETGKTAETTVPTATVDQEALERIEKIKNFAFDLSYCGDVVTMEEEYNDPAILPTAGQHPRVMFTAKDIPTIKANLTSEENALEYALYKSARDNHSITDAILAGGDGAYNYEIIDAKAFAYAIEGNTEAGYEAVFLIKKALLETTPRTPEMEYSDDSTRPYGKKMYAAAKVYDWCYDLLSEDDKKAIYAGCQNLFAPYLEFGFPPDGQSSISSHGSEAQLLRDWLSLAIAVYDEYPNAYEFVGGRFFDEYVPFRNYYYTSDFIHQGSSYGMYRFSFDLYSAWLMKAMSGQNVYIDNMQNVVSSYAYLIRPDHYFMRMGDDGRQKRFYYLGGNALIVASLFKNPVAKQLQKDYYYDDGNGQMSQDAGELGSVDYLIMNDPTVSTTPIESLPLVVYNGSPLGQMIARTGWDRNGKNDSSSDDIVVMMKIGETHVGNHDHLDSGSFQIYYKGMLAIDSSGNQGEDSRKDEYRIRTIAHNSLLIYGKQPKDIMDWGGQRYLPEPISMISSEQRWTARDRKFGSVEGYSSLEEGGKLKYAYITGDITSAYQTATVKEAVRSMLFVPTDNENFPGLFFVFDNVTAKKAEFEKVFLLHMREEPHVNGNRVTITTTENGYSGMLVDNVLLPANPEIRLIGGDGKTSFIGDKNLAGDAKVDLTSETDEGWGRVEISTVGNETDYFFNVMVMGSALSSTAAPNAELSETETHAAAKIMNCVAIFSKNSDRVENEFKINIAGDEDALTYCVSGVAAGNWNITVGGKTVTATATDDGGFLYFTAPAGEVTIAPAK